MAANTIKLGPAGDVQELPVYGRIYGDRWEDGLNREDRAASGKLRRDVIAHKQNFVLTYELMDEATATRLMYLQTVDDELTLEVTHLTTTTEYTVLMLAVERTR